MKKTASLPLVAFVSLFWVVSNLIAFAEPDIYVGSPTAPGRIVESISDDQLVPLSGNTHPLARDEYDLGEVPDSFPIDHMFLQLQRSADQEQALENLISQQQDAHSANYHQWLTSSQLGQAFGPAQADIETVVDWLNAHGFEVNEVYANAMTIDISGTAGGVREAFHTEIHQYNVDGKQYIANESDPTIPGRTRSRRFGGCLSA